MTEIKDLVKKLETDAMEVWSDDRRKAFVDTFEKRAQSSQYILARTAQYIGQEAERKNFISRKHVRKVAEDKYDPLRYADKYMNWGSQTVGGRPVGDLDKLADSRAKAILRGLPPLKKAVSIIDPDTSKLIAEKEKLEKSGQKYLDQLDQISGELDLDDLDQSMALKEFRSFVKKRDKKRRTLIDKLNDIGEECAELDKTIAKRLYSGLPGLSDAVVRAIKSCLEKATALGEVSRRVEEKVMFGDSQAALEILNSFEGDEAKVSENIRADFKSALEQLKLVGAKKKKTTKKKAS